MGGTSLLGCRNEHTSSKQSCAYVLKISSLISAHKLAAGDPKSCPITHSTFVYYQCREGEGAQVDL